MLSERTYYTIDENAAKHAQAMWSFDDYKAGSTTNEYQSKVNEVYDLADEIAKERPERADKAYYLAGKYAYRLAHYYNEDSRINMMCPSVLISGPANFPTRKKEKQNAAMDKNMTYLADTNKIIDKLRGILYGKDIISSDDEQAIEKLETKIAKLKDEQEMMKSVNAYYRKNKTLDGCEDLTADMAAKLKKEMANSWNSDKPYPTFMLSNNNANIRRLEQRLAEIQATKEIGDSEEEHNGYKVVTDTDAMRIQFFFDGKPNEDVRDTLKSYGFHWAPSVGAWQRKLTDNAKRTTEYIIPKIDAAIGQ